MSKQKTCSEMTFDEFYDWACGYLLISIGKGDYRGAVHMIMQQICSNTIFGCSKKDKK